MKLPRVKAESEITLSAIVVFAVFFYRKFTDETSGSTGHFMLGFFFSYGALAVIALGAPELAGMFALLIMAGDLLANGKQIAAGVSGSLKTSGTAPAPAAVGTATATVANTIAPAGAPPGPAGPAGATDNAPSTSTSGSQVAGVIGGIL